MKYEWNLKAKGSFFEKFLFGNELNLNEIHIEVIGVPTLQMISILEYIYVYKGHMNRANYTA